MKRTLSFILCFFMVISMCPIVTTNAATIYYHLFPVNGGNLAFGYGYSASYGGTHTGIDIHSQGDDTIYAACSGTVGAATDPCPHWSWAATHSDDCGHYNTFGNYIRINNNDGTYSYYGHLTQGSLLVSVGQKVEKGQPIATMGSSGASTGKHLHYEVRSTTASSSTINTNPTSSGGNISYSYSGYGTSGNSYDYTSITPNVYYLKNVATGKYLSVDGCVDANTTNISVASWENSSGLKYAVTAASDGYSMRPLCSSSRIVNAYGTNPTAGANVNLWEDVKESSQWWKFEAVSGGFIIHSVYNPSLVIDTDGNNVLIETRHGGTSQIWVLQTREEAEAENAVPSKPTLYCEAIGTSVHVWWNPCVRTDSYDIHLHDAQTSEVLTKIPGITDTEFTFSDVQPGQYFVSLAAVNNNGNFTANSSQNFTVTDISSMNELKPVNTAALNGSIYELYEFTTDWATARQWCELQGGHLVTVTSAEEEALVEELAQSVTSHCWLGASDTETEGVWKWVTGEEFSYSDWYTGEPNNTLGNEDYLDINCDVSAWNDTICNSPFVTHFILEREIATITYNANGGTGAPAPQTASLIPSESYTTVTLSDVIPTREGYTFLGWSTDKYATEPEVLAGGAFTVNADTTLYAVWETACTHEHTEVRNATESTCNKAGYSGDTYCSDCGELIANGTVLALAAHSFALSDTPPTCTSDGYTTYTCRNCGHSFTDNVIPMLGHDMKITVVAPTASAQGYTLHKCTRCDYSFKDNYTDPIPDENAPKIVIENKTVRAGETFTVDVVFENNPGINSFSLEFVYDKEVLSLDNVECNSQLGGQFAYVKKAVWIAGQDTDFNGAALTLTFTALEDAVIGDTSVGISYAAGDISNYNEDDVNFAVISGIVSVIDYISGDINGDGAVNNKDLTRLLRYLAGDSVSVVEKALDVNGDGTVNNKDLTRLLRFLAGDGVEIY